MSPKAWLLLSLIFVGAATLTAHAVVIWQILRARELSWRSRLWAIVPVFAPIVAWVDGRRVSPIVWMALVVTYVVLRLFS